ncbi:MAG: hypothetical protein JOZ89_02145 [Gammaproteobacteria bacterium]|nr:hypothetical protein [Gammaproteobacteria bacterium]
MGLFDWLKFKKASAANPWKPGDRVIAKKMDSYFYPSVVRETNDVGCMVVFDDGEATWVHHAHVLQQDINIGSRVFCKGKNAPYFAPGTVHQRKGETILVTYDHGEEEWTSISMVRVQRPIAYVSPDALAAMGAPVKQSLDLGDALKDTNWRIGDRVLARWLDFFWYPGTILNMGTRGIHVFFDNGEQLVVQEIALMTLIVEDNEQIFIRPKDEPQRMYSPATVIRTHGELIDVEYEDGTHETNTRVSRGRFWRCPVGISGFVFEEGDRVLCFDCDQCIYPADIVSIDDDKVVVQFLDGLERMVTPELVKRFDLKPGMKIESRWSGGPHYFPGTVSKVEGERLFVKYEDGDEEWTSIRLFRVPPKKPE